MFNRIFLIGNLGRDPELRYAASGKAICKFTVATSEGIGDKRHTEWHNVTTFDKCAEKCAQHLTKGRPCFVEGRIHTSTWADKETGKKKYFQEILADTVLFLSPHNYSNKKNETEEEREKGMDDGPEGGPPSDDGIPF